MARARDATAAAAHSVHIANAKLHTHAGPISKLLEHLRNKQASSGDGHDGNTIDALAGGSGGVDDLAAHAARALALGAAAEEAAREEGTSRSSAVPGKELDLSEQGLLALPAEVWEAGAAPPQSDNDGIAAAHCIAHRLPSTWCPGELN